jgi:hypothetical protein
MYIVVNNLQELNLLNAYSGQISGMRLLRNRSILHPEKIVSFPALKSDGLDDKGKPLPPPTHTSFAPNCDR